MVKESKHIKGKKSHVVNGPQKCRASINSYTPFSIPCYMYLTQTRTPSQLLGTKDKGEKKRKKKKKERDVE